MLAAVVLGLLGGPRRGRAQARLSAQSADLPARLSSRVAAAIAQAWGVDSAALVLSWGTGNFEGIPDTSTFRLLGGGEDGWFAVTVAPAGRPARGVRLRAGMAGERVVASRALRPGMRLLPEDIRREPFVRWGPPPVQSEPGPAAGWVVRRMIAPGAPLDPFRVTPPPLVESGQPVRVIWQQGGVSVALQGTALNDAAVGGTVRVRLPERSSVLVGTVTGPGLARMP
jgi:flagellar basal body P-ring formation protein FlgA